MPTQDKLEPALIRIGIVVVLGTIMSILDTTIVAVALHTLSHDFNVDLSTIQWVTTGYLLALAIVIPVSGWAVHRLGAKPVYITSLALFVVGSTLCGFAWSASSLILFRVIQGLGGGMIMPVGQAIMARAAGPQRMGRVMGIIGVPQLLGPILGPVIGGIIVSNTTWRLIFFVNVPIGILAIFLAQTFLPASTKDNDHRFDLTGFLLLSPGLALIVYGLSEVGTTGSFSGSTVWGTLIGGLVLCALFVLRSLRAPEPLIDMRLFKDRTFSMAAIGIFLVGATLYGTMFLLPFYYQLVRGDSAWQAGLLMAPQGIGAALIMRYAGNRSDRLGPRHVAPYGVLLLALGTLAYTQVGASTNEWWLAAALFVRGVGLGFCMMPIFAASYRNLTHKDVPKATSATNIIRQVGGSLGVAVFAVVLQTQFTAQLGDRAVALQNGQLVPTTNDLERMANAFAHSFWWSFGTCLIAVIPALLLPNTGVSSPAVAPTTPASTSVPATD